ncbi:MAG TPA: hypothetical protein VK335_14125 [Bryobacteraceae bacterium]|nr:hypothetical protein [Bryobacteraceae bacterium]
MRRFGRLSQPALHIIIAVPVCLGLSGCRPSRNQGVPAIEFTRVPVSGAGSPDKLEAIEGRVSGAQPGQRIVLFARSGMWWVQPFANQPFTTIQPDSKWKSLTHPGSAYAALLVDSRFHPPSTASTLPNKGDAVLAVATVEGGKAAATPKTLTFSGYQWEIRTSVSNRAGTINSFDAANAWTDQAGLLHLRISGSPGHWASGEVQLSRSLGYGSYRLVVRDVSRLEPAAVLSFFTWDDGGPIREMDIEISRWGEPEGKNAQYVIQPYFVAANTKRFDAPGGTLTHWMVWETGRASFRTAHGSSPNMRSDVAEHVFTSGIPSPGNERIHVNLYVYDNKRNPLRHESEMIIEKFEFRP